MLYNFLDERLLPKVYCQTPATDHYEPTNLISNNPILRSRGFIAYSVIKPPVQIAFEFICPIDLDYIKVGTVNGNKKCIGLELWVQNHLKKPFQRLAKAVYDQSTLILCRKNNEPTNSGDSHMILLVPNDPRLFGIFALRIVIFRTYNNSVPCLGSVAVFGRPSKNASATSIEFIHNVMVNESKDCTTAPCKTVDSNEFNVPPDFIDDLTCEMMTNPLTLPCGKTVDYQTLVKHCDNEKSFGRQPGDPFTGLKFTATRKPIRNIALKVRIDMFLLQNSSNPVVKNLHRTLGGRITQNTVSWL